MVELLFENLFKRDKEQADILSGLLNCYLFQDLSQKELRFLRSMVHRRTFFPGEPVFQQGEMGIGMYLITKGHVDISVEVISAPNKEEKNISVTRLSNGDFFGEISLVEKNGRRTATAMAWDEVTVLGFFKPDLFEVNKRNPATGIKIMYRLAEVLGKRLKETAEKISEFKREIEAEKK